jgi:Fe2+ or Zn2+ uptake regulation protein
MAEPNYDDEVLAALGELLVADAGTVLALLTEKGSSISRATAFRCLDRLAQEGAIDAIQLGRARFFTIQVRTGVFSLQDGQLVLVKPSPDLQEALEAAAGDGSAFLFLGR